MHPNLWQYLVLLEGLGAVATAAGVAHESLRRDWANLVGYANIGVFLVCLSACGSIAASIASSPSAITWVAAVGFALYATATLGSWLSAAGFRLHHRRDHHRKASSV